MVGPPSILSSAATPTQKSIYSTNSRTSSDRDRDGLQPSAGGNGPRTLGSSAVSFAPRGSSLNPSPAPGSFSSNLRSQLPSRAGSNMDMNYSAVNLDRLDEDDTLPDRTISALRESLNREMKIKEGSENMLEALNAKKAKNTKEQRLKVEAELNSSNQKIKDLRNQISELQRPKMPITPTKSRMDTSFQSNGLRSPPSAAKSATSDFEEPTESPTYALAEILQALEVEGLTADYYVGHANHLVELFKKYPTLKYDLVWSIFGLRMQVMLLSESREVVAAGYRMTRYAISDINSIQKIRTLNTDYLVVLSLIKKSNADVEREQALKFVRAFLDVKDGVREVSRAVVRTIAAVAEHMEDRLRSICIETLGEIMVRSPSLLLASGGLRPLADSLGEGTYEASESLTAAFLFLLDAPQRRKYLRSGYELEVLFTPFTDSLFAEEAILKQNSRSIAYAMKSWPGLMTLSMYNFRAVRSLISSLMLPNPKIRETIIDLLYLLLRIKSPFWATSFLAGRRLTTYGRVANLKTATPKTAAVDEDASDKTFVDHYTALLLAVLISSDLLPGLLQVTRDADNMMLKRKTTLLIGEVLKLASKLLPSTWSSDLQLLPELFTAASHFGDQERFDATGTVYQISSVSRTLYRSGTNTAGSLANVGNISSDNLACLEDTPKSNPNLTLDETTFRQMLVETQVLSSTNPIKWKWEIILKIIEGPLLNGKRLDEAIKASKFIKRIMSFYRPFKYKFAEVRNTRINQKYVKVGCALVQTLLQTIEGVKYLSDNKLLRQIAECLAQCDPTSGLTAQSPMFSKERLQETLCSGYFAMLGTMSADVKGLQMLDRWRIINMMYHIVDLKQRPDLIKMLLSNFDYSLLGHPRILLSKALTAGSKEIRIHATNVLRRYSRGSRAASESVDAKWAIQLLVTQLYDPEVEVCATAIKILEEACNRRHYLEYIVECRPALDHLGEIGAPLLLRFLSTSIGYHYLDGLDYISNEMDDWFLGRNDAYVGVIEASLARAFVEMPEEPSRRMSVDEETFDMDVDNDAHVPPHFYRELARTKEGCKLLSDKGHFEEFATSIRDYGMLSDDAELILKVKGCLWAVGNVGSMELGAPFLEESDVVENIVKIAEEHEVMSMRGTAFFVLGLISRSVHGLEIMSEFGWDSNTTTMGASLGLCIPQDLKKFFSYEAWKHEKVMDVFMTDEYRAIVMAAKKDDDPVNNRILELIGDLGNTVLQKRCMTELMHIKTKKVPNFSQPALFKKVMALLESHHFRLTVRRFVIELFDRSVLRQIVFEEDSEDENMDSDGSEGRTERQRSLSEL
ncbi:Rapamycin-insensitive companion of mTOR, N-term-domain-containing protein [Amylocarpus encephaloides]|uniref:Rapamycin-insensitive companion of mTOR, N-term-domain-containing protein n=1 Tax=Amylocarpus encephaloides TaxID=45428 RepID=A0A9P7YTJ2_9HELO|nr:Rapamycin-insensitive companion of mTOR, N-term-domain-containing protein [Amylocarpus encephaloides]